ncbi:DUF421 domain-containing protein [Metabacillus idriensis]|uniref:DUF421 domain-containing protein n=1 Tax=Metabacillus idriensis TaxID=324768 RepID=UPI00203EA118|nr:DUF421 domain-containing protein [Metabacillus idriensis]MCM3595175.1 DUF421 domain-containing protein [Metabacillus idriensis]
MEFVYTGLDLIIGFFGLFFLTRILGKTQITQITTFDFISALVLGELVGNAVFDDDTGILKILFAITVWGTLIYLLEIITQKWKKTRAFLEGRPTIIIHHGEILREALKGSKLDINQLQHLVRARGAFSLREVAFAILETDGTVNILKKPKYDTPTRHDFQMEPKRAILPFSMILDGEVLLDNVKEAGFSEEWLQAELRKQNIKTYREVLYAEWLEGDGLFLQKMN